MSDKTLRDAAQAVVEAWDNNDSTGRIAMEALRSALAAEQAQPRPVAWMAMRYGIPAQATTDEPTAIRWRNAGGDVRPLIYADAPPPAPVAQPAAQQTQGEAAAYINEGVLQAMHRDQRYGPCAPCPTEGGATVPLYRSPNVVSDEMVSRFLSWRLPEDFAPDCGVSFAPSPANGWPFGTNLLNADQARAMLTHVLAATAQQAAKPLTPMSDDMVLHIAAQSYNCRDAIRRAEAFHGIGKESGK